jgi:hypothetical protein
MKVEELTEVLDKLKIVNEELARVQTSLVNALDERVSLLEVLQERFKQQDEVVLEKVVYRMKMKRTIGL